MSKSYAVFIRLTLILAAVLSPMQATGARLVLPEPGESVRPNEYVLVLNRRAQIGQLTQSATQEGAQATVLRSRRHIRIRFDRPSNEQALRRLANIAGVDLIEPNRIRQTTLTAPDDPSLATQWALSAVQAQRAWGIMPARYFSATTAPASRVRVAVLDTGADCTHPDFTNSAGTSTNSVQGGQINWAASMAVQATTIPTPACTFQDDHGHGTHVAGIIGASTNNTTGVASLGYPLELAIYKVLDNTGSGSDVDIASAIVAATDQGAHIISLSLGGPGYSQILQDAVTYAWERNVLVVAAAGNSNSTALFFPAGANHAFGIASFDGAGNRSYFSNRGTAVDISAPGSGILSLTPTYPNHYPLNYGTLSGTSMAAPFVSALAGLLLQSWPGTSPDEIVQRIQRSASAAGSTPTGWSPEFGYGKIHAEQALTGEAWRSATHGSVVGQVLEPGGTPASFAAVSIAGANGTTDTYGLFRAANIPAGVHTLTLTKAPYPALSMLVTVLPGADVTVQPELGVPHGTIQGAITTGLADAAGITVQALQGGLVRAATVTDSTGAYRLNLPADSYIIRASAVEFVPSSSPVLNLTGGGTVTANLTLQRRGSIEGTVRNLAGQPVSNAHIRFAGPSGQTRGAYSNAAGTFRSAGLPAGSYDGIANGVGYPDATLFALPVTDGTVTTAPFTLGGVESITVNPTGVVMRPSMTQQFTATATGVPTSNVTWSRTPEIGTITSTGRYNTPGALSAVQTVTITATSVHNPNLKGSVSVTIGDPLNLYALPTTIEGATHSSSWVALKGAVAPAGGALVQLSTTNPHLTIPSSVLIPAGQSQAFFQTVAGPVNTTVSGSVTARYMGFERTVTATVAPISLYSIRFSTSTLVPGKSYPVTLTLNGTAISNKTVSIVSSHPSIIAPPATVVIPTGSKTATFNVTPQAGPNGTTVTLTATLGDVTTETSAQLGSAAVSILSVPVNLTGGKTATGSVTLNGPAPAGLTVNVQSSNPAVVPSPGTVVFTEGSSFATFPLLPEPVATPTAVTFSVTLGVTKTFQSTVVPAVLVSLTVPSQIAAGATFATAAANLSGKAPAGGVTITLATSPAGALLAPATVTVPAGASSATFALQSGAVGATTAVTLTATANSVQTSRIIQIQPPVISALRLAASSVVGGTLVTGNSVTITGPAPAGGFALNIASDQPGTVAPLTVVVPQGETTVIFDLPTLPVTASTFTRLTAVTGAFTKVATITVRP